MRVSHFAFSVVVVSAFFVGCAGPSVAPPHGRTVEHTPEQLARGAYLASHVTLCLDCHSTRDWTKFSGPPVPGTDGGGGETFAKEFGYPGTIVAPNITPTNLSTWSDGEVDRALTVGVGQHGNALFPMMPYPMFANLCQRDVDALVAWVRTLPPSTNTPAKTELSFPMSLIVNALPKDSPRPPCPDETNVVARGAYLANAAGCVECHSPAVRGQVIEGQEYAGGRPFRLPAGTVTSANLTPAGILQAFDENTFVARFRQHGGGPDGVTAAPVEPGAMQSPMSWTMFAGMTDDDLKAIFAYLKTLPKKETPPNSPPRWTPASTTSK